MGERKREGSGMEETCREVNETELSLKRQKLDGDTVLYVSSCSINIGNSKTSINSDPSNNSTFKEVCEEFDELFENAMSPKTPQIKTTSSYGRPYGISDQPTTESIQSRLSDEPRLWNTGIALPRTSSNETSSTVTVSRASMELKNHAEDTVETLRNSLSRISLCRKEDVDMINAQYYIVGYNTRKEISEFVLSKRWRMGNTRFVGKQWNLGAGPVYLFFSVNPDGHYSAVAKLLSQIGSQYEVEWLRIIDIPTNRLESSYLKSSTMIVQEMDEDYGKLALETMIEYEAEMEDKSALDDIKDTTQNKKNAGLRNLGNTCYMNCVLQCLAKLPWKYDSSSAKDTKSDLVREFFGVMYQLSDGFANDASSSAVDPRMLRYEVAKFSNRFATYQQQDAHELLLCLLGELNKALKSLQLEKSIMENPVQDLLSGKFRNSIKFECKHIIPNDQPFYSVTMAIPEDCCRRGSVTIDEIIESFTREEKMEAMCLSCGGELKKCSIRTEFLQFPPILILHIQRFRITESRKLDTVLRYPVTGLRFKDRSGKSLDYDLIGACHHFGSMHGGHYTADVKNHRSNKWLSCSDSSVNEINLESRKDIRGLLSSDSVSILFYELRKGGQS